MKPNIYIYIHTHTMRMTNLYENDENEYQLLDQE